MSVTVLAWLAVPLAATIVAIAWASFAARPKRLREARGSIEAYERFRSALASGVPPSTGSDPPGHHGG